MIEDRHTNTEADAAIFESQRDERPRYEVDEDGGPQDPVLSRRSIPVPDALGDGDGNVVGDGYVTCRREGEQLVLSGDVTMYVEAWMQAAAQVEEPADPSGERIVMRVPLAAIEDLLHDVDE